MFNREKFLEYNERFGPFDLDGASDDNGQNAQVSTEFCCPSRPFESFDLGEVRRLWLHPPRHQLKAFLAHYLRSKIKNTTMKGLFVVPKNTGASWYKLTKNFRLVDELSVGQRNVFSAPTGSVDGSTEDIGPLRRAVQIFFDDGSAVKFLPQELREAPPPHWTHSMTLVTDGKRVLLTREADGTSWLPGGKRDPVVDKTPLQTAVRTIGDSIGETLPDSCFEFLGFDSIPSPSSTPHDSRTAIFVSKIAPRRIDKSKALWVSWEDLLLARRRFEEPDAPFSLYSDQFGARIDNYINLRLRTRDDTSSIHVSTTPAGKRLLVVEATVEEQPCRILIDSGASENFVDTSWADQHNIRLRRGRRCRIRQADGSTSTSTLGLHNAQLRAIGSTYETTIDAVATSLPQWDLILGQPWLHSEDPDIRWKDYAVVN